MTIKTQVEEYIRKFISEIKKQYPDIIINYSYDDETKLFDIWHNNRVLQFENKDFLIYVGTLIKKILYANNIYNFSFGYDYIKTKAIEPNYVMQKDVLVSIQPIAIFSNIDASVSFSFNTGIIQKKLPNLADNILINCERQENASKFNNDYYGIEIKETGQRLFLNSNEEREVGLAA